jgi:hypothetical protein
VGPRKVVTMVFSGYRRVILVDMPHGKTMNSELYLKILKTLQKRFRRVRSQKKVAAILHHDNTGNNYKSRLDCFSPTTIQPRTYSFRFPSLQSPQSYHPWGGYCGS